MSNKIIDKIISDAEGEAKKIIADAEEKALSVIKEAEKNADAEASIKRKESEAEAKKAFDKEISGAEMKAKKIILERKQQVIQEVIAESRKNLMSLKDDEYKNVILNMLKNTKEAQGAEIIFSQKDKEPLKDAVTSLGMKVSDEVRNIGKGFIVKNGDVEYNFSFEDIINVSREDLEYTAYEILFG